MAARISIADLSDATGIPPDLLAAEVAAIQRDSQLGPVPMGGTPMPPAPPSERSPASIPPHTPRPRAPVNEKAPVNEAPLSREQAAA
jgi:hypothetical protein